MLDTQPLWLLNALMTTPPSTPLESGSHSLHALSARQEESLSLWCCQRTRDPVREHLPTPAHAATQSYRQHAAAEKRRTCAAESGDAAVVAGSWRHAENGLGRRKGVSALALVHVPDAHCVVPRATHKRLGDRPAEAAHTLRGRTGGGRHVIISPGVKTENRAGANYLQAQADPPACGPRTPPRSRALRPPRRPPSSSFWVPRRLSSPQPQQPQP